jgi:two-component system, chemotaxis family, protein-glutamate methylesterase/glutaminase
MKRRKGQTGRDIIVVGTSAGRVETLPKLFEGLRPGIRAAFFVVIHVAPNVRSYMPAVLSRATQLPVEHAQDGRNIEKGKIFIAPPDHHLLIEDGRMRLSHGPKENRHRPAIDPLFRTAAENHDSRVIGIILTGTLDDGTMGLRAVKDAGGITIVQDPANALFPDMPRNALEVVDPFCFAVGTNPHITAAIDYRSTKGKGHETVEGQGHEAREQENQIRLENPQRHGVAVYVYLPECNGPLWEMRDGKATLFRCMVGHSFGPENLFAAQTEEVERALWTALRALEERVAMQIKLADHSTTHARKLSTRYFFKSATGKR